MGPVVGVGANWKAGIRHACRARVLFSTPHPLNLIQDLLV